MGEGSESGLVALVVLVVVIIGLIMRPGQALVVCGVLSIIAGLLSLAGGFIGVALGGPGIVGGIGLIGLGRMIIFVEELLFEARGLRADIRWLGGEADAVPSQPARWRPSLDARPAVQKERREPR